MNWLNGISTLMGQDVSQWPYHQQVQPSTASIHKTRVQLGNDSLIKLLELVLTRNNFQFDNENYSTYKYNMVVKWGQTSPQPCKHFHGQI